MWNFYIHPRTHNFSKSKLHQALAFLQGKARVLESVTLTSPTPDTYTFRFLVFHFYLVGVFLNPTIYHRHCFTQLMSIYVCYVFTSLFIFHSFLHSNFSSQITFLLPEGKSFRICFHKSLWVTNAPTFSSSLMSLFFHLFSLAAFKILSSSLNFDGFTIMCVGVDFSQSHLCIPGYLRLWLYQENEDNDSCSDLRVTYYFV